MSDIQIGMKGTWVNMRCVVYLPPHPSEAPNAQKKILSVKPLFKFRYDPNYLPKGVGSVYFCFLFFIF